MSFTGKRRELPTTTLASFINSNGNEEKWFPLSGPIRWIVFLFLFFFAITQE